MGEQLSKGQQTNPWHICGTHISKNVHNGKMWSTTYPGHRPLARPVLGQWCAVTNAARWAALRCVLASAGETRSIRTRAIAILRKIRPPVDCALTVPPRIDHTAYAKQATDFFTLNFGNGRWIGDLGSVAARGPRPRAGRKLLRHLGAPARNNHEAAAIRQAIDQEIPVKRSNLAHAGD